MDKEIKAVEKLIERDNKKQITNKLTALIIKTVMLTEKVQERKA